MFHNIQNGWGIGTYVVKNNKTYGIQESKYTFQRTNIN